MFRQTVAALAVAGCLVTPVSARVLKYVTYPAGYVYAAGGKTDLFVYQISGNSRETLPFRVPSKPSVVITYNATCDFISTYNGNAWLDVDVIIDGTVIQPSEAAYFALCGLTHQEGAPPSRATSRGSITVVTDLAPGLHNLRFQVTMRGNNGPVPKNEATAIVGYSTLTIETGN